MANRGKGRKTGSRKRPQGGSAASTRGGGGSGRAHQRQRRASTAAIAAALQGAAAAAADASSDVSASHESSPSPSRSPSPAADAAAAEPATRTFTESDFESNEQTGAEIEKSRKLVEAVLSAQCKTRIYLVTKKDHSFKVTSGMHPLKGKEYDLVIDSELDDGRGLRESVALIVKDFSDGYELRDDMPSGTAIYVRPSPPLSLSKEHAISPRLAPSRSDPSGHLFKPVHDTDPLRKLLIYNSFKVGMSLENNSLDYTVLDFLVFIRKKLKGPANRKGSFDSSGSGTSGDESSVGSVIGTSMKDVKLCIEVLPPTHQSKKRVTDASEETRVDSSRTLRSFTISPPHLSIGVIKHAVVREALKLKEYDDMISDGSMLYVKEKGTGTYAITVPEDSTDDALDLFKTFRKKARSKMVTLKLSLGARKEDSEPLTEAPTDPPENYSQQVADGDVELESPAKKRDTSSKAGRHESQSKFSREGTIKEWLIKAINTPGSNLHKSLSPKMLDLATKKLNGAVGAPVYSKYTFIEGDDDTWPPDIDVLISPSYWEEDRVMRYLGGDEPRYPEVGKYETDEETGKPIEVPEEASSAGGKGKGNGMAKALENFGKSMCDGLKSFGRASTSAGEKSKYEKLILIRDVVSDREGAVKTDEMRIEIEALDKSETVFDAKERLKNEKKKSPFWRLPKEDREAVKQEKKEIVYYHITDADDHRPMYTSDDLKNYTIGELRSALDHSVRLVLKVVDKRDEQDDEMDDFF